MKLFLVAVCISALIEKWVHYLETSDDVTPGHSR